MFFLARKSGLNIRLEIVVVDESSTTVINESMMTKIARKFRINTISFNNSSNEKIIILEFSYQFYG